MAEFSHYDKKGRAVMVDVGGKEVSRRLARARGTVTMNMDTLRLIREKLLPKGDCFEIARIAGIAAAKRTSDIIPLCHPLSMTFADVVMAIDEGLPGVVIESEIRLVDRTGAEMEALTAVAAAALTVYDMCKAVDKSMVIGNIELVEKKGGKSDYKKTISPGNDTN